MFAVAPAAQAIRARRTVTFEPAMLWTAARNRTTGAEEGIGLWEGGDVEEIEVTDLFTGQADVRPFYNQAVLSVGPARWEAGLNIRSIPLRISALSAAAINAFLLYEARGARVQAWRRSYDPETTLPVALEPWFRGYMNVATITRPAAGGEGAVDAEVVSSARLLTISSAARKSDEAQRGRGGDRFRQYKASQGAKDVPWALKGRSK